MYLQRSNKMTQVILRPITSLETTELHLGKRLQSRQAIFRKALESGIHTDVASWWVAVKSWGLPIKALCRGKGCPIGRLFKNPTGFPLQFPLQFSDILCSDCFLILKELQIPWQQVRLVWLQKQVPPVDFLKALGNCPTTMGWRDSLPSEHDCSKTPSFLSLSLTSGRITVYNPAHPFWSSEKTLLQVLSPMLLGGVAGMNRAFSDGWRGWAGLYRSFLKNIYLLTYNKQRQYYRQACIEVLNLTNNNNLYPPFLYRSKCPRWLTELHNNITI